MQQVIEVLKIRLHNEQAFQLKLHNFKSEFKDPGAEKMMRDIERKHADHVKITQEAQARHHGKS